MYLREITPDYTYYGIASPWLQTKVLRTLQYFPLPEGTAAQKQLHDVLQAIFNGEHQLQFTVTAGMCRPAVFRQQPKPAACQVPTAHRRHRTTSVVQSASCAMHTPAHAHGHPALTLQTPLPLSCCSPLCAACGETAKSSTVNKSNAQHAILFEAISLILAQDFSKDLLNSSVSSLGRFLTVKVGACAGRRVCLVVLCHLVMSVWLLCSSDLTLVRSMM